MRWKTSHHGHDPRLNDLLAILALLVLIVGAWQYFGTNSEPPSKAAIIPRRRAPRPSSYRAKAYAGEVKPLTPERPEIR